MKKRLVILISLVVFKSNAQNLVLNPSFENTIPCWIFINLGTWQMQCTNWYSASGGSPDYFSETYDQMCYALPVPQSTAGYQYARTGIAYVGLAPFFTTTLPTLNRREYIGGILSDTLKHGHKYCVSFYVSVADEMKYVVDGMGIYLSADSAVDYTINTNLPFIPQIENPAGNIIYDTLNWVQISGTYIANGGEKYLTIGNFKDDAHTAIDSTSSTGNSAYYFIDDVSVIDCTVGINEIENLKDKIKLMPNPAINELRIMSDELRINKIEVCDVLDNVMLVESAEAKEKSIKINVGNFAKGIYFVKVFSDKGIGVKKFIKE